MCEVQTYLCFFRAFQGESAKLVPTLYPRTRIYVAVYAVSCFQLRHLKYWSTQGTGDEWAEGRQRQKEGHLYEYKWQKED